MSAVISSLSSLPSVTGAVAKVANKELGKDEFLKLLTTQLQHQDPLNPMDSQAFVAQLAQFAQVEQLDGLGKRLDTMLVGQAASNQVGVAGLVGRQVRYRADGLTLGASGPATFEANLDGSSDATTAVIADANGKVVRTIQLGARSAGTFSATWDGLDDKGNRLPAGDYVLSVSATRKDGGAVIAAASIRGTVTGVSFEGEVTVLRVGGRDVKLSDVVEISTPSTSTI